MLKVTKFGGSSMADAGQYRKVKEIVLADPHRKVVIVSAAGKRYSADHKLTDLLYLCHAHTKYGVSCDPVYEMITSRYLQIRDELQLKVDLESEFAVLKQRLDAKDVTEDELASRGEYFSAKLMAAFLDFEFVDAADWIQFNMDGTVDKEVSYAKLKELGHGKGIVIPGFYGAMPDGRIRTFTRGGSDITGALAAAALDANVYENWTDVSGILMADPRIVENPQPIPEVTYDELRELSYAGAQVLHEGTIQPVREKGIPVNIRNTMFKAYRPLFTEGRVNAISSYSPRCIMSMYEFVHQLSRLDNDINVTTLSGRATSTLMRFFDGNTEFKEYLESDELRQTISNYEIQMTPLDPMLRLMAKPAIADATEARKLVSDEFDVLTGLEAISMSCKASDFFTTEEQNALWSCANFSHYMKRSANTLSTLPADIAAPLLRELVASFERFIENPQSEAAVQLRFGHAETLMPLLALMRLQGCYYLTRYYDTVGKNWCDFHVTPMAANLQLILFRSNSGRLYIKALLNETAVPLIPGKPDIYVSWPEARDYLNRCTDFIL